MTYCVALALRDGLVMLSDTRTNAGVDNIATVSKLFTVEEPGERMLALMCAGNLAITQSVMSLLFEGLDDGTGNVQTLNTVPTMFAAAQLAGQAIRQVHKTDAEALKEQNIRFDVSLLLGGQVKDRRMRLFRIYSAGNFIEAVPETPFLQIGEHKYGKPILDRAVTYDTPLGDAVKLALVSMDSTLRSNLTVGLPADLLVYRRDSLQVALKHRITEEDEYFRVVREHWGEALRSAHRSLPTPGWDGWQELNAPSA